MRSLKRLGAAFFATSMLCTINVANAKIFVGTSQVAENVNLIDKDLIESQNNELIAGKKKKKKKLNKKVVNAILAGKKFTFLYRPDRKALEVFVNDKSYCRYENQPNIFILSEEVSKCIRKKLSIKINQRKLDKVLKKIF